MHRPSLELIAFALSAIVFTLMAAPSIVWMDGGELIAAGFQLGGAHPPGHPAHTLLAKLATLIPIGEIAFRVNLLSALCMAAAVAGTVALTRALMPSEPVAAGAAGLLVLLSPIVGLDATRAEVYAPVAALVVWAAALTVRFYRAERGDARHVLVAALACGAAAAFHPLIAASAALPLAVAITVAARRRLRALLPWAVGLGALGLLTYAYLPIRANAMDPPLLMWGDPGTADTFTTLLTAPAYQGNFSLGGTLERFSANWLLAGEGVGIAILFVGLVGLAFGALTRLRGAGVLLAAATCVIAGASTQEALNPDMPGYVLPAVLFLAAGVGPLVGAVIRVIPSDAPLKGARRHLIGAAIITPVLVIGLVAGSTARASDAGFRRGDDPTRLWSQTVAAMPPGPGIFFAQSDHLLFASQYERLVAGGRPDVAVANSELCRDRWFLHHIDRSLAVLHVPFVDPPAKASRQELWRGRVAEGLAFENLTRGVVVGGEYPALGRLKLYDVAAMGRAYRYALTADSIADDRPARPPPRFKGDLGARIAGSIGMARAIYEASGGRLADAAVAAGIDRFFDSKAKARLAAARPSPARPALFGFARGLTPVFIFEPWQAYLLADDLAWVSGTRAKAPDRPFPTERKLHAVWRAILAGEVEPSERLPDLGRRADDLTATMLVATGRGHQAELHLEGMRRRRGNDAELLIRLGQVIGRRETPAALGRAVNLFRQATELEPSSAEAFTGLGLALDKLDRDAEAARAWRRALELDPSREYLRSWLRRLTPRKGADRLTP